METKSGYLERGLNTKNGIEKLKRETDIPVGDEVGSSVKSLVFSPNGEMLASGMENFASKIDCETLKLSNVAERKKIATFKRFGRPVSSLAFSPDVVEESVIDRSFSEGDQIGNILH